MGPALKELRDSSLVVDDMFGEGIARGTVEYHGTMVWPIGQEASELYLHRGVGCTGTRIAVCMPS